MRGACLRPPAVAEIVFDTGYLLFAVVAGTRLLAGAQSAAAALYGALALVLGAGDAFHLVPRIYSHCTGTMEQNTRALGLGKLVTSITMTVFYALLYGVWQLLFGQGAPGWLTPAVVLLAAVRIVLCLLPGNGWLQREPPLRYAVYRNIPFTLLGILVLALFIWRSDNNFRWMPLAIFLSFLFYLIVVLFAGKKKALGALMLPKTCAYIWIICMGFSLLD